MRLIFFRSILTITLLLTKISSVNSQEIPSWPLSAGDLDSQVQPEATAEAREKQKQETISWLSPDHYDLHINPINDSSEPIWREILWAIALDEPKEPRIEETLNQILTLTEANSQKRILKRAFQTATEIYLADEDAASSLILKNRFLQIIQNSNEPSWVAMSLSALVSKEPQSPDVVNWLNLVRWRFLNTEDTLLETTLKDVQTQIQPIPLPPLTDLLNWQIAPKAAQLYVFCRPDRRYLCLAVLKDRDGRFVYQRRTLWSLPLLARSINGLRSQFQFGQSPAGIYRIEGVSPRSESRYFRAYGQFPLVKLFLPGEEGVSPTGSLPTQLNAYQALLPPSWRGYFPMEQTFWAGQLGRGLIRIHGTGEGLDFFGDRFPDSYGWNPTTGCISALEVYDSTGRLEKADMPKILRAISQNAGDSIEGYLILVEIPQVDSQKAVTVEDIQSLVQSATDKSQTIKVEPGSP